MVKIPQRAIRRKAVLMLLRGSTTRVRVTHSISARATSTVSVQTYHARGGYMRASACDEHRQRRVFRERPLAADPAAAVDVNV